VVTRQAARRRARRSTTSNAEDLDSISGHDGDAQEFDRDRWMRRSMICS